jgi:hypothetical protein
MKNCEEPVRYDEVFSASSLKADTDLIPFRSVPESHLTNGLGKGTTSAAPHPDAVL